MSRIFYDEIINLKKVEKHIKQSVETPEERDEMYQLIDEILHHRLLGAILEKLPKQHHKEFLDKFSDRPHDETHFEYLAERVNEDIREFLKKEVRMLSTELLAIIYDKTRLDDKS